MGPEEENDGDEEEDSKGSNGDNAYGEDMESIDNAERHFTAALTSFVMFLGPNLDFGDTPTLDGSTDATVGSHTMKGSILHFPKGVLSDCAIKNGG